MPVVPASHEGSQAQGSSSSDVQVALLTAACDQGSAYLTLVPSYPSWGLLWHIPLHDR